MFFFIVFRRLRIFLNQKPNMATFEGEGVCMSLTRKNLKNLQNVVERIKKKFQIYFSVKTFLDIF